MVSDYSSVTVYVPYDYYTDHLPEMLALSDRFHRLNIAIGGVDRVTVSSLIHSVLVDHVAGWSSQHLPPE